MLDSRIGSAFRAVRIRRRLRQVDVAIKAGVSRATYSRAERGHLDGLTLGTLRRIAAVLDIRLDLIARWNGEELDRLLNARHSAMHERVAKMFLGMSGWVTAPEVSFSIYGERGVIDILAWHAATRTLLVIELKTAIADAQAIIAALGVKRRLASQIVAERGWVPDTVACWLLVAEGATNRRRVGVHRELFRSAMPQGHAEIRRWLHRPAGPMAALSFLSSAPEGSDRRGFEARRRVRRSYANREERMSTPRVTRSDNAQGRRK